MKGYLPIDGQDEVVGIEQDNRLCKVTVQNLIAADPHLLSISPSSIPVVPLALNAYM
jgi:hypothetical protein